VSIAIATCAELPDGDEDAPRLRAALQRRGLRSEWRSWDDALLDWSAFDLVVVRSTWDYTGDREAFVRWAYSVDRLVNPADVIEWNTDKTYLRDLARAGLAVVPTDWALPGETIRPPESGEFVVKPSVGAGSKGAGRFAADQPAAARDHAALLHRHGRTVMVQPYLGAVDTLGETALIYVDGQFSHAIGKAAMLPETTANGLDTKSSRSLYVHEKISPRLPGAAELALGAQAVDYVQSRFGDLVYLRVDLLPSATGPVIIELELVEPSLFLEFDDGAADRLAAAIARRLAA